jgi:uncharacterized protein (TIGR02466 family)
MNSEYQVLPLFSKVFYLKNLNYITDNDLLNILKYTKKENYKETHLDNNFYSQHSLNLKILNQKNFLKLKKYIIKEFDFFKNNILKYNNINFVITNSWLTKTEKNQFSYPHNHNNSMFSGIFYIDVNDNQKNISFENLNRSTFSLEPNEYNIYNSNEQTIYVKTKSLIFFPSEVHHSISKNISSKTRYSLAFNILPTGQVGLKNTDSEINININ